MQRTTEQYEADAAIGLIEADLPLQELAAENICLALQFGIIRANSAKDERTLLEESIKAGRTALQCAGITVN